MGEGGIGDSKRRKESCAEDDAGLGDESAGYQPQLGWFRRGSGTAEAVEGGPDRGDQVGVPEEFNGTLEGGLSHNGSGGTLRLNRLARTVRAGKES